MGEYAINIEKHRGIINNSLIKHNDRIPRSSLQGYSILFFNFVDRHPLAP